MFLGLLWLLGAACALEATEMRVTDERGAAVASLLLPSLAVAQLAPWPATLHLGNGSVACAVARGEGTLLLRLLGSPSFLVSCDTRRVSGSEAARAVWLLPDVEPQDVAPPTVRQTVAQRTEREKELRAAEGVPPRSLLARYWWLLAFLPLLLALVR
jgi:hypothetical protein